MEPTIDGDSASEARKQRRERRRSRRDEVETRVTRYEDRKEDEIQEAEEQAVGTILVLPPFSSMPYHWQRPYESKPKVIVRIISDQRKQDLQELLRHSDDSPASSKELTPSQMVTVASEPLLVDLHDLRSQEDNPGAALLSEYTAEPDMLALSEARRPLKRTGRNLPFHESSTPPSGLLSFLPYTGRRKKRKEKEDVDPSTSDSDTELEVTSGPNSIDLGVEGNSTPVQKRKQDKKRETPVSGNPFAREKRERGRRMVITGDGIRKEEDEGDLIKSLSLSTRAASHHRKRVGSQTSSVKKSGWSYPFPIDIIGDDFEIKFYDDDVDLDNVSHSPSFLIVLTLSLSVHNLFRCFNQRKRSYKDGHVSASNG